MLFRKFRYLSLVYVWKCTTCRNIPTTHPLVSIQSSTFWYIHKFKTYFLICVWCIFKHGSKLIGSCVKSIFTKENKESLSITFIKIFCGPLVDWPRDVINMFAKNPTTTRFFFFFQQPHVKDRKPYGQWRRLIWLIIQRWSGSPPIVIFHIFIFT